MRSHRQLTLRMAKAEFTWVVRQVQGHGTCFVITKDGEPAAAVVPFEQLQALDARSARRGRKVARLLRQLGRLLPGASAPATPRR